MNSYYHNVENNPNSFEAHRKLGQFLQNQGQLQEATASYERAIELNPSFAKSYHNLGQCLAKQKKFEEAIVAYQRAIEIEPLCSQYYHSFGDIQFEQKCWNEASELYQKAIQLNPDFAWSHYNLGRSLAKERKSEEAIVAYERAIEIDPKLTQCYRDLGDAWFGMKHWDKAAKCYHSFIYPNKLSSTEKLIPAQKLDDNLGGGKVQVVAKKLIQDSLYSWEKKELERYIESNFPRDFTFFSGISENDEMFAVTKSKTKHKASLQAAKNYLLIGWQLNQSVIKILSKIGKKPESIKKYLDFAGGYGRATRFSSYFFKNAEIYISDIDKSAVDFASKNMDIKGIYSEYIPEDFECEEKFDLILVVSLFTHLQPPTWDNWLKKLLSLLSSDGVIIFTTHPIQNRPKQFVWVEIEKNNFYFAKTSEAEGRLDLNYYGASAVSEFYASRTIQEGGGKILMSQELGLISTHGVSVAKKDNAI